MPTKLSVQSALLVCCLLASACSKGGGDANSANIHYPTDETISQALRAQFTRDPANAEARQLVQTLGGAQGRLDYRVKEVIYRQGSFEARYDAVLHLGQAGAKSLEQLYGSMLPTQEQAKLSDKNLGGYETWLRAQAEQSRKKSPQEAAALVATLDMLNECYRKAAAGSDVVVIEGLAALISPARSGWHADKLASPATQVRCLPV